MPFRIQDKFQIRAPVDRVWSFLIDPKQVAVCIPGAELAEVRDDGKFVGNIKIKVGPVTVGYKGVVQLTEVDEQAYQVRMVGEGRETAGAGSAKVTMVSRITATAEGAEVTVDSEVDLVGRIVQFGRGMIEEVAKQLFQQFSRCVKEHLEVAGDSQETNAAAPFTSIQKPVPAITLAFRALWSIIVRAVSRLAGRRPR